MDPVFNSVRQLASEIFDVPAPQITSESAPANLEAWDSVAQLNLMLALEEQFGVKFEPEDFEKMQTIGQVVAAVKAQTNG